MPLRLQQTVGPQDEALSLAEIKAHLRLTGSDEDVLLQLYLDAAQDQVERMTRRQLLTATFVLTLDDFPACGRLALPHAPLQSITEVTYLDSAGDEQTVATTVYGVDTSSEPGTIYLKNSQTWPSVYTQQGAVMITYVAGWPNYAAIPASLKMLILLLIGHFYEHREATIEKALTEIPNGIQRLFWLHRVEVLR